MTESTLEILQLKCLSSSLQPLRVQICTAKGGFVGEVKEIPRGGILRFTKFRSLLGLRLELRDTQGQLVIFQRAPGLWRKGYDMLDADGRFLWRFQPRGLFAWELYDSSDRFVASLNFRNPLIVGPQAGHLQNIKKLLLAEIRWHSMGIFSTFPEGSVLLLYDPERFRLAAIGAALIRLCDIQQR